MSDGASMSFAGMQQLLAEMAELPDAIQKRLMKGAVATGASVIRKEAILLAPSYTGPVSAGHPPPGTLKRAIYQTRLVEECTATVEAWKVDVRRGKNARSVKRGKAVANLDAYYASWVEYGHYTRAPKGERKNVRSGDKPVLGSYYVMARPYMRPAFEGKKAEALQAMQDYLDKNMGTAVLAMKYINLKGY